MTDRPDITTLLKQALEEEARRIEPRSDTLAAIRARTRARAPWYRNSWFAGAASAGLATAVTVVGVTVLSQPGERPGEGGPTDQQSPAPAGARELTVPVYYLGDTTRGPRLFREFHRVRTNRSPAVAAVAEMLQSRPADPDYRRSTWQTQVRSVTRAGGVITVDLTAAPDPYPAARVRPGSLLARLTVQQLVYTAQAAEQSTDPVRLTVNGAPVDEVLGVDTSQPVERADPLNVQAMLWITSPAQGQVVSSPVHVEGIANVFEANVSWQVLSHGRLVKQGFTSTGTGMELSPFDITIRLPAGNYTLRCFEASAQNGRPTKVDTKAFTVR